MARTTDSRRVDEARRLYHAEDQPTIGQVAGRLGVHESTVRRWLRDDTRPPGPKPARDPWRPAIPQDHGGQSFRLADLPKWLLVMTEPDWSTGCMIWRGRTDDSGYGRVAGKLLHREVWQRLAGPIGEGMTLDHVRDSGCRSPACWAPWHLEEVTEEENQRRTGIARKRPGRALTGRSRPDRA
jgi:hypothetical protein